METVSYALEQKWELLPSLLTGDPFVCQPLEGRKAGGLVDCRSRFATS